MLWAEQQSGFRNLKFRFASPSTFGSAVFGSPVLKCQSIWKEILLSGKKEVFSVVFCPESGFSADLHFHFLPHNPLRSERADAEAVIFYPLPFPKISGCFLAFRIQYSLLIPVNFKTGKPLAHSLASELDIAFPDAPHPVK